MMNRELRSLAISVVLATTIGIGTQAEAQEASGTIAAVVGGQTITSTELEELAQGRLLRVRSEEHDLRQQVLEETIDRLVLEREATKRGLASDELLRIEVEAKVAPVTDAETRAAFEMTAERPGVPAPDALARIASTLRARRTESRRQEFLRSLRSRTEVRTMLDPPRIVVRNEDAPAKGPENAPVTIVEFSEFQCSYCARVTSTLQQVRAHYGDKVRIVFRHFPLPTHKEAGKAAEAALCAGEQQKFWEMHDSLFANQNRLQVPGLKQIAADLSLERERFNTCLDSGKYAEKVQADVSGGTRYGVAGTPAFFINGRSMVGAQPYENFARVIDEELTRAGVPHAPLPSP